MSHSFSLISTLAIGFAIAWRLASSWSASKYRHWLATCSPVLLFRPQHPDLMDDVNIASELSEIGCHAADVRRRLAFFYDRSHSSQEYRGSRSYSSDGPGDLFRRGFGPFLGVAVGTKHRLWYVSFLRLHGCASERLGKPEAFWKAATVKSPWAGWSSKTS